MRGDRLLTMIRLCYHWFRACFQTRRDMKCVCVVCISLSMFAVFLLSYMSLYELQTRRVTIGGLGQLNSRGSETEENGIEVGEVVDTRGKEYKIHSFLNSYQDDSVELHASRQNKVVTSTTKPHVHKTNVQTMLPYGWIPKYCTGHEEKSELLTMVRFYGLLLLYLLKKIK